MTKILFAGDCSADTNFINFLKQKMLMPIDQCFIDSSRYVGMKCFRRHFSYFIIAIKAFRKRNNYSYIIFWQQFIGFYYGLILKFWPNNKCPRSITAPLIYKQRDGGFWLDLSYFVCIFS